MSTANEDAAAAAQSDKQAVKWPRFFKLKLALASLCILHVLVQIDWRLDQDNCTFGPVSNARYRALLKEAKKRQARDWPPLVREYYKGSLLLEERIEDLSRGAASVYERIAVMHAVMRAMGANYLTTPFGPGPYEKAAAIRGGNVFFEYRIDINQLGFFAPLWRTVRIVTTLSTGPTKSRLPLPGWDKRGEFSVVAHFPNLIDRGPDMPPGPTCPPVPSAEFAAAFSP